MKQTASSAVSLKTLIEIGIEATYNLELNGDHPEVENLHCWPQHEVGLQSGQIHISELCCQCSLASTFGNSHVGEKASQTYPDMSVGDLENDDATTYRKARI